MIEKKNYDLIEMKLNKLKIFQIKIKKVDKNAIYREFKRTNLT